MASAPDRGNNVERCCPPYLGGPKKGKGRESKALALVCVGGITAVQVAKEKIMND
jgi:hypothetical protein